MTTEGLDEKLMAERKVFDPGVGAPAKAPPARKRGGLRSVLVWVAVLAALGFGLRYWLSSRQNQPAPGPKLAETKLAETKLAETSKSDRGGAQPVGVATIGRRDIHVTLDALGTVTPLATVTLVSQISGVLEKVGFVEGQKVKEGDFLAQIDDRPYQALKAQYEGQRGHDQGLLEQARSDEARYALLLKQKSIASQTAENQKLVVKQYEGTVASDQALIDAQALNIAYCHIVSPVEGRVGLRLVDPGNYVTAGTSSSSSSGLVVVTQTQPISVIFSIPEDSLRRVAPQLRAGKALPTEVYDRSNVRLLAKGETRAIDNQVDSTTGMVKLRAFFDNADESLFANQFVNARLLANTITGALAAPVSGIQHGAPGDYAWVISPEDTVSIRKVKLGQMDGDMVQVLDGLGDGDRIVVDGADRLREGGKVRLVAGDGAAAQPSDEAVKPSEAVKAPDDAARQERRWKQRERKALENGGGENAAPAKTP